MFFNLKSILHSLRFSRNAVCPEKLSDKDIKISNYSRCLIQHSKFDFLCHACKFGIFKVYNVRNQTGFLFIQGCVNIITDYISHICECALQIHEICNINAVKISDFWP